MVNFIKKRLDIQSKTLIKNSSWVFFSTIVGIFLTFLRAIVIARGLGAELFGVYTIIVAFITIVMEVLNLNLGTPLIKFGAQFKAEHRIDKVAALIRYGVLITVGIITVSVLAVTILTYTNYDTFIKAPGLRWFAIMYSIVAGLNHFNQLSRGTLRLYFKFKLNSIVQILMDILELGLISCALLLYPKNLELFLAAILISRCLNSIIPSLAAIKELMPDLKNHLNAGIELLKENRKTINNFVINNSFGRTVQSLINNGDVMLIGVLSSSPKEAAYYAVGKKLAWSILSLSDPLQNSIYPQFCKLYAEGERTAIKRMLLKITAIATLPAALFILVTYFFNEWIIKVTVGSEYLEAGPTFFLLTGAALLYSMFFWIQPLLQSLDLVSLRLRVSLIGLVTGIISASLLIPKMGAEGMAVTMILMNVVMPGFFIYFALRKLDTSIPLINN
jgi:O-antigen/teichoic acid export membrane protein